MRALRILAIVLIVLGLGIFGLKSWFLDSSAAPETSDFELDIERVRQLATAVRKPRPTAINVARVGESALPSTLVIAGSGFEPRRMIFTAYQLLYPDGEIIVDSALDQELAREFAEDAPFSEDAYASLQRAMLRADAIVITHEHLDHIGGIARAESFDDLEPRLLLSRDQLENAQELTRSGFPERKAAMMQPLDYQKYHIVAPGVVLIKAPGHTPGSQLVYVQLEDGREFLFVGDVAWHMDNVRELTGRPRLISDFVLGEDREVVLGQLRTLHDLMGSEKIHLVVSHDAEQLDEYIEQGLLGAGFEEREPRAEPEPEEESSPEPT
ncbi:MAG: MBL fold metallo-hydrolase [Myxococcales bacterium]|nr:MBL fold metallo-hydrolase [Myxococcales bacterium]